MQEKQQAQPAQEAQKETQHTKSAKSSLQHDKKAQQEQIPKAENRADKAEVNPAAKAKTPAVRKPSLLRSGAVTALATFLSRILGMIRDMCIASLLGASLSSDVYFFANRIPNFFRRLFAEGAFSQAFVPVITEYKQKNDEGELKRLISATAGTLGLIVLLVSIFGMIAAPAFTALFGFGWFEAWLNDAPDAHKFTEAAFLLRLTFPYLFFITLTALCCSLLNVYGKFAVPAAAPCLLNIVLIIAAVLVAPDFDDPNMVQAVAMSLGGVAQLLFVLPSVMRLKLFVLPKFSWSHPGVKKIRTLMIPGLIGVSASQINLLVNTVLATFLATGSISYLYYSDRLLEFPIGIFAVAISTVILPALARSKAAAQRAQYEKTLDWGVRLVLFLGIPSALGILALREPILRVIFMRGAFTSDHVYLSAASLMASVSGLCCIMLVRVLVQGFAALQDTKTPVRCAVTAMGANIVFNLILVWPLDYVGLALSTALAAFVNAGQLIYLLIKRGIYKPSRYTLIFCTKVLTAGLIMAFAVRYLMPPVEEWFAMTTFYSIVYLAAYIALGAVVFAAVILLLGIRPRELKA